MSDDVSNPEDSDRLLEAAAPTDHSLLRRFKAGSQDAATELYVRYAKRLHALARAQTGDQLASRFDPEDVVQSVFRTFFRRAVESGYEAPAGEELWQLLLVMALNKIRSLATHHRAQKRDVSRTSGAESLQQFVSVEDGDAELAYKTMKMVIEELVSSLPSPQDQIVSMRIEGYELQEIAERTQRSKRTVERTLQQFRSRLAKSLELGDADGVD
ncbi:MAG: RNA polymerase sigma factor [Planctomycetales bacterium]|nr:RNA polymerase sigma factor [Planctomycetales bacterium]